MAVSHCAKKLKRKPLLLDFLKERTRAEQSYMSYQFDEVHTYLPQAVIERAVDVLADEVATSCSLDDPMICYSIGNMSENFSFI